ncbi:hypothetical protein LZ575_07740 [Antarcticibacterium sp. 1MA-6-2]|uniref:hypothetical protein n=1 Tax=Antarcticibacterium sp. 1MA-6-2 TaxID=2908210 RepID=UPI001F443AD7|nr:hypothetical protein [Antarcticibacterium sp. 1MA-6-2]UJH92400.1 hypothetical protein LZ575_07740 [Antarcticibacterium sp. 1MA-6-2]
MKRIVLIILICFTGCKKNNQDEEAIAGDAAASFKKSIQAMHNKSSWENKDAVAFDIELIFNGQQRLKARVTSLTNSSKIRLDKSDGTILVFNGEQVFLSPADVEVEDAGFDLFAWQYFFALPFKLNDRGAEMELLGQKSMMGNILYRARLTVDQNIEDSPNDWYILYQEADTGLLFAAAYTVTLNKEKLQAQNDPQAIIYRNYEVKEGIPVSTRWTFHNWSEEDGFGEEIGEALITNISFLDAEDQIFERPQNSKVLNN